MPYLSSLGVRETELAIFHSGLPELSIATKQQTWWPKETFFGRKILVTISIKADSFLMLVYCTPILRLICVNVIFSWSFPALVTAVTARGAGGRVGG